jgi:DNA-binding transcriptional LysR family regulator
LNFEWSDLRYFLAVARMGSASAAARSLGVNQTTCARRIVAFEKALGARLFERAESGYTLTPIGTALVSKAEQAEAAATAFGEVALASVQAERRLIRFATSDWMADHIAKAAVSRFAALRPDIRVIIDVQGRRVDLTGGDADVALRGGYTLDEPTLIARKVADTPWAFYCSIDYARNHGAPRTMEQALRSRLAIPSGQAEDIFRKLRPEVDIGFSSNSTMALVDAIVSGDFIGPLPDAVGDNRDDLIRCCSVDYTTPSLWIVYPERLRGTAHIRAFVDHMLHHIDDWSRQRRAPNGLKRADMTAF